MSGGGTLTVGGGPVTLAELRRFHEGGVALALDPSAVLGIEASAATVSNILASGRTAYGINTGFGALAQTHINSDQLAELQRRLVLSHCVGVGPLLSDDIVRLILALKVIGLARGYSGVRPVIIQRL